MIRAMQAEFIKLRRRSVLFGAGSVLPLLAIIATVLVFALAKTTASTGDRAVFGPSLTQLGQSGGLSRGFTAATGFIGLLVLVVFIAATTSEWGHGTIRMVLTRQPYRARVFAGKAMALLAATAVALALALVVSVVTAYVMAAARGIPTDSWLTGAGLQHAGGAWLRAMLSCSCFGLLGIALGLLIRSTTVAITVAFAWFFPLEHIIQNAWAGAGRWFPGLLFDAVTTDGNSETSFARALLLAAVVVVVFLVAATRDLRRRDITG